MRFIILTLLIAITTTLSAQNWAPINTTDIYNYKADTASAISHSLWIDSVSFNGTDSIYYPNRIVKHISNSLALKNQPQFLNKQLTVTGNGLYLYNDPSNISYYSLANLNDSYTYDSTNNIIATVVSIDTATILGNNDSIKTLGLSSGDTIIASKNHGFVQYPVEYGSGKYYRLVGIEGGRTLGEHVLKFNDFFNYAIGDTFWYYNFYEDWLSILAPGKVEYKTYYTIDTLYTNADTVFYGYADQLALNYVSYNINKASNDVNSFPNTLNNFNTYHSINRGFSPVWYNMPYVFASYENSFARPSCINGQNQYYQSFEYNKLNNGFIEKRFNAFYCEQGNSDTLAYIKHLPNSVSTLYLYGHNNRIFVERLGLTELKADNFETTGFCKMYAYRLAGDSTITILDQDLFDLVIGVDEVKQVQYQLLGNPVSNAIKLQLASNKPHGIHLYNLNGQMLLQHQTQDTQVSMDVSDLPQGLYLLEVRNASGVSRERVIKL